MTFFAGADYLSWDFIVSGFLVDSFSSGIDGLVDSFSTGYVTYLGGLGGEASTGVPSIFPGEAGIFLGGGGVEVFGSDFLAFDFWTGGADVEIAAGFGYVGVDSCLTSAEVVSGASFTFSGSF